MIEVRIYLKPMHEKAKTLRKLLDEIERKLTKSGYTVVSHEVKTSPWDDWVWF